VTRLQRVARREALVWDASFFLTLGWIVFGALPLLAILVLSLVFGNYPTDQNPVPEGYPAFTPPWFAMYPLVALQVVATIVAFPLPMRGRRFGGRLTLLVQSAFVAVFTLMNGTFALGREGSFFGLDVLFAISMLCVLAVAARIALGWLRVVPRSWREYLDDEGRVVPPDAVARDTPRRPWDGVGRLLDRSRR